MTGPDPRAGRRPDPFSGPRPPTTDPEQVLAQALRAMAGGPRPQSDGSAAPSSVPPAPRDDRDDPDDPDDPDDGERKDGWTAAQVVLLAAVIGLTLGVVAGLLSLILG